MEQQKNDRTRNNYYSKKGERTININNRRYIGSKTKLNDRNVLEILVKKEKNLNFSPKIKTFTLYNM
jgi:hypothetical protein